MLTDRDNAILESLQKFGVMSRDHIAKIHCQDVARPEATASRICLRLVRQGHLIAIPQAKDRPYIYKHPESKIRHNSSKLDHHLAIVDTFIDLKQPEFFIVEPDFSSYKPDVYCRVGCMLWCIEVQKSKVSNGKIQKKINEFVRSYQREEHDATNLWLRTPYSWERLQAPSEVAVKIAANW